MKVTAYRSKRPPSAADLMTMLPMMSSRWMSSASYSIATVMLWVMVAVKLL